MKILNIKNDLNWKDFTISVDPVKIINKEGKTKINFKIKFIDLFKYTYFIPSNRTNIHLKLKNKQVFEGFYANYKFSKVEEFFDGDYNIKFSKYSTYNKDLIQLSKNKDYYKELIYNCIKCIEATHTVEDDENFVLDYIESLKF